MVVIGLVAMNVNAQPMLVRQCHREPDGLNAVFPGQLEVRDPADHVRPEFGGTAHQVAPAVEAENSLLREGDKLQIDDSADLLAQVDQGPQSTQLGVADIHVTADVLNAARKLLAQDLPHPCLHVGIAELVDSLGPDRDAFEQ